MMWFLLLLYIAHIEPVILQAPENRLILRNEKACEGHIEIYHDNTRGYVGDTDWSDTIEEVVCRSTHCGQRVSSTDVQKPDDGTVWLNEVICNGTESHLWNCKHCGWNISTYRKEYVKKIKCSNEIKIGLDGFRCAGAVQYSNGKLSGYFCADNWGEEEANLLCKSLKCGTGKIPEDPFMVWDGFKSSKKMLIKCSGIENVANLWQCVTEESSSCSKPASVICTEHERLQLRRNQNDSNACSGLLEKEENGSWNPANSTDRHDMWCQQMNCGTNVRYTPVNNGIQVKCTDSVTVDLRDNDQSSKCYGAVHIKVNDTTYPVCAKTWTSKNAEVVCRELNCMNVVSTETKTKKGIPGIMDNVNCAGSESSLWHCNAKHHKTSFSCDDNAYVVCEDSVKVRLVDGPGECAGRVEIKHKGRWQRVVKEGWTDTNSDVVCRELGCGGKRKTVNPDVFSQGSGDFLAKNVHCTSEASRISECIKSDRNKAATNRNKEEAQGITCEEHKVVFLKGNEGESCSGRVGIAKGEKTYWLSGSNETWNQESANAVCRQMHCGEAKSFDNLAAKTGDVWKESYNCSSNTKSLFACENTTQPPDHSHTFATVNCSDRFEVKLTNECWGNVNVCVNGKCEGVCADTWTDKKSVMLCENLGCGSRNLPKLPTTTRQSQKVFYKSLHTTHHTTNLSQCNFVKYDENDKTCNTEPASVVCSNSVKPRINATRDKCFGNVEVHYGGQWLPVCTEALSDSKTRNTICKELHCGHAVDQVTGFFRPVSAGNQVISQIQCENGKDSLAACDITSATKECPVPGGLQCSSWRKMALEKSEKACSGDVFVRSKGEKRAVSVGDWTETEGNQLCQYLQCGKLKSNKTTPSDSEMYRSFNCAGVKNPKNIWECENQTSSSKEQLSIECQDEPNITLSNDCHGEVRIDNIRVCATEWNNGYSHLVCQEQGCSNAIADFFTDKQANLNEDYYHVSCEKYHYKLGQCKRFLGQCDGKLVSVYCVHNVKFNTTEKCGGEIEVNYQNGDNWEKVCPSISSRFKEKLCEKLKCGGRDDKITILTKRKTVSLETTLSFTEAHEDIKYSVQRVPCKNVQPAEVYCEDYVSPPPPPPPPPQTNIVPIILGVGFLLILVILIVVFIRIRIVKKAKNAINVSSRMSSRKEVEFESGDYEDVTSKANEMEDFSRGRFRSEAEVITESDARSTNSFPYDDIDEATEAQPLTSQAATAGGASVDNYIHEGALNQSADEVTYEVDDPQENYDDIEASPEITQTIAEVHHSPQTTPESVTAAPLGLVQGDEDYLVPGQDG